MAVKTFKPYALKELPTSNIDPNGLYFIKADVDATFRIYLRKNDNSDWIHLGYTSDSGVTTVNNLTGDVKIDLNFASGVLKITATGTGTASAVTTINLDARYVRLSDVIDNLTSTDTSKPLSANQGKVLKDLIDGLSSVVESGLTFVDEIDCSSNPNFPQNPAAGGTKKGDLWIVSTAGKIGGASGKDVDNGNLIIAKKDGAGNGSWATHKDDWVVIQSDLDYATESIAGFIMLATQAEVNAGSNGTKAVTPATLQSKLNSLVTTLDNKYVRYDAAQSLSSGQKTQARTNIGAADDSMVIHTTGAETASGLKTFTDGSKSGLSIAAIDSADVKIHTTKEWVEEQVAEATKWEAKEF